MYHDLQVPHLRRPIKASLQKVIEHSLKDHEFRANALDVIDDLTNDGKIGVYRITNFYSLLTLVYWTDQFRQFFHPSIPYLLTALLIDRDEHLHESIKNILFKSDKSLPAKCKT